jgi:DEAD/DEAH box helicase domain-containing protein
LATSLLIALGKGSSWAEDWASRAFQHRSLLLKEQLKEVLHQTMDFLTAAGLLTTEACGHGKAWGIPQAQLQLSLKAQVLACDTCGATLTSSDQERPYLQEMGCLKKGCIGHYQTAPHQALDYYRQIYQQGQVQRIYALEHTGLLERARRERLEYRFIQGDRRCDPNLLSATSTLEMGINIGDLSSVVLCSIPPNTANFQQRLGRAGRTDGNAFTTAIANGNPHDLYFYSTPHKMIQGNVNPAGCYLDAAAILERQLTAFCLDSWVKHYGSSAFIPPLLRDVLSTINARNLQQFPYPWLDYLEQHQGPLLQDFLGLFEDVISPSTAAQLRLFLEQGTIEGGLQWRILNQCFEGINQEVKRLKSQLANIRTKIKTYKEQPEALQEAEHLEELDREKRAFTALIKNIENKNVLNFLTDEGFLPNYAFPESGVTLRSIIWRKIETSQTGQQRYENQTLEYERPGKIAIKELVPGGSFYAEGRRVKIDQVDLQLSKPQDWRFCPNCNYAIEADLPAGKQKTCPRCAHSLWSDQGQVRKMLKLKQVFARTSDRESRFGDDSEDRDLSFFQHQLFVDFEPDYREQTLLSTDPDFPFGLEYISKATFREINLGESTLNGEVLTVAGQEVSTEGFRICGSCGKILKHPHDPKEHTINCQYRTKPDQAKALTVLYLYREFQSEALRLLMPDETFWTDQGLHSFIALLQLGLKEEFKGKVDHLQVTRSDEPQPDSSLRKSFLYLYDTIPGGTGYLKQLIQDPTKLKEIFIKAKRIVTTCQCEDGCYECLYAYRNSHYQDQTSRHTTKKLLKSLLNQWDKLEKTEQSLSSIRINTNFDSELERKFIEVLQKAKLPNPTTGEMDFGELQKVIFAGRTGYLFKLGGQRWRVETQVDLDNRHNVAIPCTADFVFYPLQRENNDLKPIVVFTDGWEYHQDRLEQDFQQRLAILRSQNYLCWSLTWDDVHNQLTDTRLTTSPDLNALQCGLNQPFQQNKAKLYAQYRCDGLQDLETKDSCLWLLRYLSQPDTGQWQRWALLRILGQVNLTSQRNKALQADCFSQLETYLSQLALTPWRSLPKICLGKVSISASLEVLICTDLEGLNQHRQDSSLVFLHLQREQEPLAQLRESWREALRLFNLYQFLDPIYVTSDGQACPPFLLTLPTAGLANPWEAIQSLILDEAVLQALPHFIAHHLPVGEPGYELCDADGNITAIAELAWPDHQLALTTTPKDQESFLAQGWQSWACEDFLAHLPQIMAQIQE